MASTKLTDPAALSGPLTGISFLAGVGTGLATANSPYPRPGSKPAEIRRYFGESPRSARISAAGQAVSAGMLIPFTKSVAEFVGRSGRGSRALQAAAVAGGAVAV